MEDIEGLTEELKRLVRKIYSQKDMITTVRLDVPTYYVVEELRKAFGISRGEAMRLSAWLTAIILDPSITVRRALSREAIEKITKGEDVPLIDALRPLGKLLEEEIEKLTKKEKKEEGV